MAPSLDPQLIAALRADLRALGSLDALFSPSAWAALGRDETVPARAELEGDRSPEATAARLFLLGDAADPSDIDAAFAHCGAGGLLRLGVLEARGNQLRAALELSPVELDEETHWFASDRAGGQLAPDHVLGVGGASLTLAGITDRAPRRRALDLGTGCGIQAAGLASHVTEIVATDISPRALRFAALNAALADRAWDLRHGSLFEPVASERFDLIVSNPPFVITPQAAVDAGLARYEYRDSGHSGDQLLRDVLSHLHRHLNPGAAAQLLGNWEHAEESWQDRLGDAAVGLDLWVIERELLDPAEYVEMWLRDGGMTAGAEREGAYAAWLEDFHSRGVEGIGFGYVLARPQSRPEPLRRFEQVHTPATMPIGAHLAECFDALQRHGEIADLHLRVAEDVTIERHYRAFAEEPTAILARQGGGLGRTLLASTALAGFFSVADGELTAGQIAVALEALMEEAGLAQRVLNEAAEAHEWGFLVL